MGEILKYLTSTSDRARFWRREGSVLEIDLVALRQMMDEENTGQWQQKGTAVGWGCIPLSSSARWKPQCQAEMPEGEPRASQR